MTKLEEKAARMEEIAKTALKPLIVSNPNAPNDRLVKTAWTIAELWVVERDNVRKLLKLGD